MLSNHSTPLTLLSTLLSAGLVLMPSLPAIAHSAQAPEVAQSRLSRSDLLMAGRLGFTVRGVRPSRDRIGGISRGGSCSPDGTAIRPVAIQPPNNPETIARNEVEIETTVSERPVFFVYIPESLAQQGEFLLTDENQTEILYEATFDLPEEPGVGSIQIPESAAALEVGKIYHWSLALICDPVDRSADLIVDGWVQRIEPDAELTVELDQTEMRDRPQVYAEQGIWQDTIATLAALRYENPDDTAIASDWESLFRSVNLADYADAPLFPLASPETEPQALLGEEAAPSL